jgi:hypothetical protein
MSKVAIHGFGRIGRSALKASLKAGLWSPISISDVHDAATFAALFEVDSNYGRCNKAYGLNSVFRSGAPDTIRTCGLHLRRVALYPAELPVHLLTQCLRGFLAGVK